MAESTNKISDTVQKRIIVIGGTTGIGYALASKYVAMGCRVGITGRSGLVLSQQKALWGASVCTACFDVSRDDNRAHLAGLIEELGGLDILIYNAGYGNPSLELDGETELLTTETNVNGFVEIIVAAYQYFLQKGGGHIVLTSSVAGLRGNRWSPAYSASKAFMSNYAEGLSMASTKQKSGIVITDIRPGFLATKMAKGNRRFWVAPVDKAVAQIVTAIARKKRVAYVTRRWWLVAQLMKIMPYGILRRIV